MSLFFPLYFTPYYYYYWLTVSISLQDLAVNNDVKAGKVMPGQYLILSFDFSAFNHSDDLKVAEIALNDMINDSIKQFYSTYILYPGKQDKWAADSESYYAR